MHRLFLFHLLEWADVDFELDVEELNARWANPDNIDSWGQLVIKHTADSVELITAAPKSGIWRIRTMAASNTSECKRTAVRSRSEQEAFFLRIAKPGDYKIRRRRPWDSDHSRSPDDG